MNEPFTRWVTILVRADGQRELLEGLHHCRGDAETRAKYWIDHLRGGITAETVELQIPCTGELVEVEGI